MCFGFFCQEMEVTDADTSGTQGGTETAPMSRRVPVYVPARPGQVAVLALQCAVPRGDADLVTYV